MKTKEEMELETSVELIINAQKVVHLDTAGRGDHMPRARKLCIELGIPSTAKNLKIISDAFVNLEDERVTAIREGQRPRLEMTKKRLMQMKL